MVSSLRVNIGPLLQQPLDYLVEASVRSRLQCVAIVTSLGVDIGSILEQPLGDLVVTPRRSRLQCVTVLTPRAHIQAYYSRRTSRAAAGRFARTPPDFGSVF